MAKIALSVLGVLLAAGIIFYAYYGGFGRLKIAVKPSGGETLIYEKIKGDYRQSGAVMDKIYYSLLNEDQIETYKGFGIYYDSPKKVPAAELRSEAGCVLEEKDRDKLPLVEKKYAVRTFPALNYITAEFPYKGKMSVLFSLLKVYPALNKFAVKNGFSEDSAVMEIYDIPNKRIVYRKVIENR